MLKRRLPIIAAILTVVFLATAVAVASNYYVGSKMSNKYHLPSCKWAKRVSPSNLITFCSLREAQAAGYVPCKVCRP